MGSTRELSRGELFLQMVFSGYASVAVWWSAWNDIEYEQHIETVAGDYADASSLERFFQANKSKVCDDGDWDFEWRCLTWLPAFDPSEDKLLTAAVEVGRACTTFASGSTRAASDNDAPWEHMSTALAALSAV